RDPSPTGGRVEGLEMIIAMARVGKSAGRRGRLREGGSQPLVGRLENLFRGGDGLLQRPLVRSPSAEEHLGAVMFGVIERLAGLERLRGEIWDRRRRRLKSPPEGGPPV